jgi:hypothetical protein
MRAYVLLVVALLVPAAAAFDFVPFSNVFAAAAKVFFLVAPIVLAVGSVVGLLARRRF